MRPIGRAALAFLCALAWGCGPDVTSPRATSPVAAAAPAAEEPPPSLEPPPPGPPAAGVWAAIRLGDETWVLLEGADPAAREGEALPAAEIDEEPQPMIFTAAPLEGAHPSAVTVLAAGEASCVARPERAVRLTARCPASPDAPPDEPAWVEAWAAVRVDCAPRAHRALAIEGAHPDARLDPLSTADVRIIERSDDVAERWRVFQGDAARVDIEGPTYPEDAHVVRAAELVAVIPHGHHGSFRVITPVERSGELRRVGYPMITCAPY